MQGLNYEMNFGGYPVCYVQQEHFNVPQISLQDLHKRVSDLENMLRRQQLHSAGQTLHSDPCMINPSAGKVRDMADLVHETVTMGKKTPTTRLKQQMVECFRRMQSAGLGDFDALERSLSGRYHSVRDVKVTGKTYWRSYIPHGDSSYYEGIMPLCLTLWPNKKFQSKNMWLDAFEIVKKEIYTYDVKGNLLPPEFWTRAMNRFYLQMKAGKEMFERENNDNYASKYKVVSQALDAATTYMQDHGIENELGI